VKRVPFLVLIAAIGLGAWALPGAQVDSETQGGVMPAKQRFVPCLWFREEAGAAVEYYCSIFPDAKVLQEMRMGPGGPLISARFQIAGQEFIALNGNRGPSFTDASSLLVHCGDQKEVDDLWAKLTADGGEPGQCGWLKDKYGVSWQIIPTALLDMISDKDPAKAKRAIDAMLPMRKIDIAVVRKAYEGR